MEINSMTSETKKSMKTRILTAIGLIAVGVPCILLGGYLFTIFILVATLIITHEFLHASRTERMPKMVYILLFAMMISFVFWIYTDKSIVSLNFDGFGDFTMVDIRVSTLGLAFFVMMLFFFVISFEAFDVKEACYIFTMSIFCSISLQSALFLRYCPEAIYNQVVAPNSDLEAFTYSMDFQSSFLLIYVAGGALICDAYAYFVGVLFGKHKLNPRISPKKTWEGFFGGVILTTITGIAFLFICDACGAPVLKGVLDIRHWYWCVLFSILIPIVSVLGDLMFSAIKRYYAIKDFGKVLPGHGGILDRFDSVLITSLVTSALLLFIIYSPWNALIQ